MIKFVIESVYKVYLSYCIFLYIQTKLNADNVITIYYRLEAIIDQTSGNIIKQI